MEGKKITIPLTIFIILCMMVVLLLLGRQYVHINDKWSGVSDDKNWKFNIQHTNIEYQYDMTSGYLSWIGKASKKQDIYITKITFTMDNKVYSNYTYDKKEQAPLSHLSQADDLSFLDGITSKEIGKKKIAMTINWRDGKENKVQVSHIKLKKHLIRFGE